MTHPPDKLLHAFRTGERFVLTGHKRPDGDSLGSALGLARVLRAMGKSVTIWNLDEAPTVYRRMPGADRIHCGEEPPAGFPDAFSAAVTLECPSLARTGLGEQLSSLRILNLDHHLGNEHYGELNWVDTSAPALGVMIARLAHALSVEMDPDTATVLYLALETDTGGFRFANATAEAFDAAADLVRHGARVETVAHWIHDSQPAAAVRLLGEMIQTLDLHDEGRVATVYLTDAMFERAGATAADAEDLVDHPRSIEGVQAVAFLRQLGDGEFKGSLRSRGPVNVESIARDLGGGGHKNAAGFETTGAGPEEILGELVTALSRAIRQAAE